jgi:hypothetical protein
VLHQLFQHHPQPLDPQVFSGAQPLNGKFQDVINSLAEQQFIEINENGELSLSQDYLDLQ